jgi:hypothetical protein
MIVFALAEAADSYFSSKFWTLAVIEACVRTVSESFFRSRVVAVVLQCPMFKGAVTESKLWSM